jgi:hypothetical protein
VARACARRRGSPFRRDHPGAVKKVEHVPPDTTAAIFWLKNRDPAHWRDAWQLEHVTGKYVISDKPMTEEQWIRERATVVDVTPTKQIADGSKQDDEESP